jgi:hypothetical protein
MLWKSAFGTPERRCASGAAGVVMNAPQVGRLPLRIVGPISEWKLAFAQLHSSLVPHAEVIPRSRSQNENYRRQGDDCCTTRKNRDCAADTSVSTYSDDSLDALIVITSCQSARSVDRWSV